MKPENWDTMSEQHKTRIADDFMRTTRARWLIGQALYRAAEAMCEDPQPEVSNIEDMEVLSRVFPPIMIASRAVRQGDLQGEGDISKPTPMSEFSKRASAKYQDESHR